MNRAIFPPNDPEHRKIGDPIDTCWCPDCGHKHRFGASLDGGPSPAWRPHNDREECPKCGGLLWDHNLPSPPDPNAVPGETLPDWFARRLAEAIHRAAIEAPRPIQGWWPMR